ncbi:unnamed protein product [Arabis nemorensis]|uniref:Uncharacterized protein n=1 Tax=Arabis nemorensis TaxID=586526 RepID=A0A565BIG0_9BRAS|nr:unnamed protein product [Arabis nemorensis]
MESPTLVDNGLMTSSTGSLTQNFADDATSYATCKEVDRSSATPQEREGVSRESDLGDSDNIDDSDDLYFVKDEVGSFSPLVNDEVAKSPDPGLGRYIELELKDDVATKATVESLEKMRREWRLHADIEFVFPSADQRLWAPPEGYMCLYESFFLKSDCRPAKLAKADRLTHLGISRS